MIVGSRSLSPFAEKAQSPAIAYIPSSKWTSPSRPSDQSRRMPPAAVNAATTIASRKTPGSAGVSVAFMADDSNEAERFR